MLTLWYSFAKERVDERFGEKPIVRHDMLGSFISRGLSQEELESETLTQMYAPLRRQRLTLTPVLTSHV